MLKRWLLSELDEQGNPVAKDYSYEWRVPMFSPTGSKYHLCQCTLNLNHLQAIKKDPRVIELGSLHENPVIPAELVGLFPDSKIVATDTLHQAIRKLSALHLAFEFEE